MELDELNIKAKLTIGFLFLIVLVCTVAGIGIIMLSETFDRMNAVVNDEYQKIELASDIRYEFNNMAKASSALASAESESQQNDEINRIQGAEDRGELAINKLKMLINSEEGQEGLSAISMNLEEYSILLDKQISLIKEGKKEEAANFKRTEGKAIEDAFFISVLNLVNYYEMDMESALVDTESKNTRTTLILTLLSVIGIIMGLVIAIWITRSIVIGLNRVSSVMGDFSSGKSNMSTRIEVIQNDEIGLVATSFNRMAETIEVQVERELRISKKNEEQAWMMQNLADLTTFLQESKDLASFSHNFIQRMTPIVGAKHGVIYLNEQEDSEPIFNLTASYAYKQQSGVSHTLKLGEGLIGQAGLDKQAIMITDVPNGYVRITSGIGEATPGYLFVVPIVFENRVRAVFEIASFQPFSLIEQELALKLANYSGIIIDNIAGRIKMMDLLQESQTLTEELQTQSEELSAQHEELKQINNDLEKQTKALLRSELNLQQQQEELEQSNVELEEKAVLLEEHNQKFEIKNREVEQAKVELEEKAIQLELTSKYKSEFLANMSHELRTPLNSLLILSKLLADNKTKNLSDKQVEFAKTINSAGCDLLDLIDEILDLAKVESGKIDVELKDVKVQEIIKYVQRNFNPIAHDRGLDLQVVLEDDVEEIIRTDEKRLQQILKNLLANAFKFTHSGRVILRVSRVSAENGEADRQKRGDEKAYNVAFSVTDTGIGIAKDKQSIIFEAFQQADGTTSRKYGGTGLGLSISREHASALYGNIEVESKEGKGSTFTLLLPVNHERLMQAAYKESAVTLDEKLYDSKENQFNEDKNPTKQDNSVELLKIQKDLSVKNKRILIIEDNQIQRESMIELIQLTHPNIQLFAVSTGNEALQALQVEHFDCMIVDLGLEDMTGIQLLRKVKENESWTNLPIFIYTGKELTEREETELKLFTKTIIVKGARSHERLLEEISLFIRQIAEGKSMIKNTDSVEVREFLNTNETFFMDKKILIVDDDVRNVFALSSILEGYDMNVLFAENGREALEVLNDNQDTNLVLMDIMMPEMDGYEAITRIREMNQYAELPIIALTAKAMKDDREKCIAVGASDYISKPIINHQLLSLMRVWLYR